MRLDGTGFTNVGDARGDSLNVVGDWLYYKNLSDQDMTYRIRTDGTQKEKLQFNKANTMAVTKDRIYYTDDALFYAGTDGSEPVKVMDGAFGGMSLYDAGYITAPEKPQRILPDSCGRRRTAKNLRRLDYAVFASGRLALSGRLRTRSDYPHAPRRQREQRNLPERLCNQRMRRHGG
jgi:hypothetical protein